MSTCRSCGTAYSPAKLSRSCRKPRTGVALQKLNVPRDLLRVAGTLKLARFKERPQLRRRRLNRIDHQRPPRCFLKPLAQPRVVLDHRDKLHRSQIKINDRLRVRRGQLVITDEDKVREVVQKLAGFNIHTTAALGSSG